MNSYAVGAYTCIYTKCATQCVSVRHFRRKSMCQGGMGVGGPEVPHHRTSGIRNPARGGGTVFALKSVSQYLAHDLHRKCKERKGEYAD